MLIRKSSLHKAFIRIIVSGIILGLSSSWSFAYYVPQPDPPPGTTPRGSIVEPPTPGSGEIVHVDLIFGSFPLEGPPAGDDTPHPTDKHWGFEMWGYDPCPGGPGDRCGTFLGGQGGSNCVKNDNNAGWTCFSNDIPPPKTRDCDTEPDPAQCREEQGWEKCLLESTEMGPGGDLISEVQVGQKDKTGNCGPRPGAVKVTKPTRSDNLTHHCHYLAAKMGARRAEEFKSKCGKPNPSSWHLKPGMPEVRIAIDSAMFVENFDMWMLPDAVRFILGAWNDRLRWNGYDTLYNWRFIGDDVVNADVVVRMGKPTLPELSEEENFRQLRFWTPSSLTAGGALAAPADFNTGKIDRGSVVRSAIIELNPTLQFEDFSFLMNAIAEEMLHIMGVGHPPYHSFKKYSPSYYDDSIFNQDKAKGPTDCDALNVGIVHGKAPDSLELNCIKAIFKPPVAPF